MGRWMNGQMDEWVDKLMHRHSKNTIQNAHT